jgi:hypothetical protein
LSETLDCWDEVNAGALEGFLGSISYRDRAGAERSLERVTKIVRKQFDGQLPSCFKTEIRQIDDERFNLRAEYIDWHGDLQSVC